MFVSAVLSALIVLQLAKQKDKNQFYLLGFMLVATMFQMSHFVFFNYVYEVLPFFDSLFSFNLPAFFVFYYYYIDSLTTEGHRTIAGWLLLSPAFLCLMAVSGLYIAMDAGETSQFVRYLYGDRNQHLTTLVAWQWRAHMMVTLMFVIMTIPMVVLTLRRIKRYNDMVLTRYSDTEDKTVANVFPPFSFLLYVFVVALLFLYVRHLSFLHQPWIVYLTSIVHAVLLILIGSHAMQHHFSFHDIAVEEAAEDLFVEDAMASVPDGTLLRQRVMHAIKEEKLFLQPNLKISDLARHLNTNRSYIYNVVNVEMGLSFAELVNRERVSYAVELIKSSPEMLLSDVAIKSGFTSNASFYRNFKKYQGVSPKECQQQLAKD